MWTSEELMNELDEISEETTRMFLEKTVQRLFIFSTVLGTFFMNQYKGKGEFALRGMFLSNAESIVKECGLTENQAKYIYRLVETYMLAVNETSKSLDESKGKWKLH
jgi:hypothetical protein